MGFPRHDVSTVSGRNAERNASWREPDALRRVEAGTRYRRCEMVNTDQVKGVAKQVKGSVKEAAGKATGNKQTEAEGTADKIAGKVQKAYGDAKEKVKKSM